MGALAHYLEEAGIPTTQISLVREHTEAINPPQALWVPFDLGRPLGVANDRAFQLRVLVTALRLLEALEGPVLVDFLEEARGADDQGSTRMEPWACPVNFGADANDASPVEALFSSFTEEMRQLRPWYDLRLENLDRTAMVLFAPDVAAHFLGQLSKGEPPDKPPVDLPLAAAIRIAAQDIKAFYYEASTAKPGSAVPTSEEFGRWFWHETAAGRILASVRQWCSAQEDETLRMVGAMFLIPMNRQ